MMFTGNDNPPSTRTQVHRFITDRKSSQTGLVKFFSMKHVLTVRELWTIRSSWYRLPLWITWHDARGEVTLGASVPLLRMQRERMEYVFQGKLMEINGKRFINRPDLIGLADKVEVIDPEELVEWSPQLKDIDGERETPVMRDFIRDVVRDGWFTDEKEASKVWRVFMSVALRRMLHDHKPIDMGFVILRPTLFRHCWQSTALREAITGKVSLNKVTPEVMTILNHNRRWSFKLGNPQLIDWNIEAVTTPRWRRKARTREAQHRKEVGTVEYHDEIVRWTKENATGLLETLRTFLEEGCRAEVQFFAGYRRGVPRFLATDVPHTGTAIRLPAGWNPDNFLTHWEGGIPYLRLVANRDNGKNAKGTHRLQTRRLLSLPVVRSTTEDMRDTGRDVQQSPNETTGTTGMPVLHAGEGND